MESRSAPRVSTLAGELAHRGPHPVVAVAAERLGVVARLALEIPAERLESVSHLPVTGVDALDLLDTVVALEALTLFVARGALVLVGSGRELVAM
jgi:hypothetical protein